MVQHSSPYVFIDFKSMLPMAINLIRAQDSLSICPLFLRYVGNEGNHSYRNCIVCLFFWMLAMLQVNILSPFNYRYYDLMIIIMDPPISCHSLVADQDYLFQSNIFICLLYHFGSFCCVLWHQGGKIILSPCTVKILFPVEASGSVPVEFVLFISCSPVYMECQSSTWNIHHDF